MILAWRVTFTQGHVQSQGLKNNVQAQQENKSSATAG